MSSLDAMIGLTGMVFLLLFSMAAFSFLFGKVSSSMDYKDMEARSHYAMGQLLSRGDPQGWNALNLSQVNNFGISSEDGILSRDKILSLNSTIASNYSFVAARLGISKYNYSIQISNFYSGVALYYMGNANTSRVISQSQMSTLDGSLVLVQLRVAQ